MILMAYLLFITVDSMYLLSLYYVLNSVLLQSYHSEWISKDLLSQQLYFREKTFKKYYMVDRHSTDDGLHFK